MCTSWIPAYYQIAEEFAANHAERILLGNWDQFVILTLLNAHTASITSVFHRDPALSPTYPPGSPLNPHLIEVILGALLSTGMATDASLWRDLAPVRAAVQADERERRADARRDKLGRGTFDSKGNARTASSSAAASSRTVATLYAAAEWERGGGGAQHEGPTLGEGWVMVAPETVYELIDRLHRLGHDDIVQGNDADAGTPPLMSTPTQSPPSSPLQASPERLGCEPVSLFLDWYLASGRMYDVYAGRVSIGGTTHDAALKYLNLASFYSEPHCGGAKLAALDNELDMLARADAAAPGIAPRLLGLWTRGRYAQEYILALEDCGSPVMVDAVADDVRTAYGRLHAAGLVHADVEPRHVLRDGSGRVRIIDWEAGHVGTPQACEEEQVKVEAMVRLEGRLG